MAETEAYGSYAATVVELSVASLGGVDIKRIVVGIDCGYAVHPDNIVAQLQGSVTFALTAMLIGEGHFEGRPH